MAKIKNIYSSVWEKLAKTSIFDKKWPIFIAFGQNRANFKFSTKNKSTLFRFSECTASCKKSEKSIAVLEKNGLQTDTRTDAQTLIIMSFPLTNTL